MLKKIIFCCVMLCSVVGGVAQIQTSSKLPGDSLVADFRHFCDMLEATHPDPYTAFGGRPFFRKSRDLTLAKIVEDSLSLNDFCRILNDFTVPLRDMHTFVQYPNTNDANDTKYVCRITFNVLNDGIMLSGISQPHSRYLGSRLLSINGVPVDTLSNRMIKIKSSENNFGNLQNLISWGIQDGILRQLGVQFNDSISYSLLTPQGDTVSVDLPLAEKNSVMEVEMTRLKSTLDLPSNNLQYSYLDERNNTMYLRVSSVMARENYKYSYQNGWNNAQSDISYYYHSIGKEMPQDMEEAIKAIPSFSEEFHKMLLSMKDNDSENLIIDLRGNGGGWTRITYPSMIMMYGDEYYQKDFDVKNIRLLSDLYFKKTNQTIDQLNQSWGTQFAVGDYVTMREYMPGDITAQRNRVLRNTLTETPELLQSLDGNPLYKPKRIFVVTDPNTNSAAFHYAFYLWKMGATLVGVPSSQAPNTFMEITPFKLPYSGLTASVSNTMQQFLPASSTYADVLTPDIKIESKDYSDFNFDSNTPILKILEMCK